MTSENHPKYRFDRMEVAGSLGDLGTLLPLAIGMILLNKLHATNVFMLIGFFYIVAGHYFGVPVAVQPMKVIGAYAIATGLTSTQIIASSLWMGVIILFLGTTGLIQVIGKYTPKSTVRGVQLGVGVVLMIKGLKLMILPDPNLAVQAIGPVSMSILLGAGGLALTFLLLDNRKLPAALVLIFLGILLGLFIGKPLDSASFNWSIHFPKLIPYGWPSAEEFLWVLPILVLPQIPMTIGNAIISNTDIMHEYFGDRAHRATYRSVANSQGLADIVSFFLGGIPMCHGAGGLAAHYRFGARTAGSNLIIRCGLRFAGLDFRGEYCRHPQAIAFLPTGSPAGICRLAAHSHDPGPPRTQRPVCGPFHAGHRPGYQPGRCLPRRDYRRLCLQK